jgi:AcrR family transcriptional regulator
MISLDRICRLFGVTKHSYYKYFKRKKDRYFEQLIVVNTAKITRERQPKLGVRKIFHMLQLELKSDQCKKLWEDVELINFVLL